MGELDVKREDWHAFLRMYVLLEPRSFSISFAKSRDISSEAILANVQSASPTVYILEWFMSLEIIKTKLCCIVRHTFLENW